MNDTLSLCKNCWCMTKTIKGVCGKCKADKSMKLTNDQLKEDFEKDLETEKLITGKNVHSVLHICPKHGTSCYAPFENDCEDCKLYLSGADIRAIIEQALATREQEVRDKVESVRKTCPSCSNNPEEFEGDECYKEYNQAIDDVLDQFKK